MSREVGPTGHPRCPHCQNSLNNSEIQSKPQLIRCAECKNVFEVPKFRCDFPNCNKYAESVIVNRGRLLCKYHEFLLIKAGDTSYGLRKF